MLNLELMGFSHTMFEETTFTRMRRFFYNSSNQKTCVRCKLRLFGEAIFRMGRCEDLEHFNRIHIDRTQELETWAERVQRFIEDGVDVYGFNNHYAGFSPGSVDQFSVMLGVELGALM